MRPALIALIAAALPLGAYAHPGWTQAARETAKPISDRTDTDKDAIKDTSREKAPKTETAMATVKPAPPSVTEPPLCVSPEVVIWNPAATGNGVICTPTLYAALERKSG